MAVTYDLITATSITSATTNITLSSIPSTYTDLVLITSGTVSSTVDIYLKFNSSSSGYGYTVFWKNSSTYGSNRGSNEGVASTDYFGVPTTSYGNITRTEIFNYANTNVKKTWISRANNGNAQNSTDFIVGSWSNTAAISSITVQTNLSANMSVGFTIALYGIKAA